MVKRTTVLILLLLLAAPLSLLAAQVSAVADRDRLGEGESLQLELRVQGSPDDDPDLSVLDPDWEILSRSQSSQMQIVNGDFSRSVVYSLTLMPRRSGQLEIPAVCFGADCSSALPIEVGKAAATSLAGAEPLLLEAEATPQQALVGSQVLLTVRLLHRIDLAQASLSEPQPQGVEAEMQQLGKDRSYETRRQGYLYQVVERRYALFAQKAGTLRLPGLQLDAQVAIAPSRLDPFGRSLRPVRRYSEPIEIRVDPPPADAGDRDWLPARGLTLEENWQEHPPRLRAGEPATRTLLLRAPGLPAAHLPELKLQAPAGWKCYPDQPSRRDDTDAEGIVGNLQQKIALVPTRPGTVDLPAVDLDWYDVAARRWRRAHLDPVRVTVAPAAAGEIAPAPQPPPLPAQPAPAESASAKPSGAQPSKPTAACFWPWLSLALGIGWLLSLLLLWRQRRRPRPAPVPDRANDPDPGREKDALRAIWAAAANNDPGAARRALLAWSRCRWPSSGRHDLEVLAERCGEPLAGELARLGRALYARSGSLWKGAGLVEDLRSWLKRQQAPTLREALPPLYPETGKIYS